MKYLLGIQPTGKIHIGNYMGCIAKGLRYQEQGHEVTFMLANYHSLTTNSYTGVTEKELVRLGCKNIVKQTPEYTELFFKLCCKMNLGTLLKMPQYKDKKESVDFDMGILLYPVLMAADIIMNDPDVVLIGKDQVPHLDLTNDICKRVGKKKRYNYELGDVEIVLSLLDSTKKMSKSLGEKHVLYVLDENYHKKLKGAVMDLAGLKNLQRVAEFFGVTFSMYTGNEAFKNSLADAIQAKFGDI